MLPRDSPNDFPNIKIPSDDFICKRIEATIEGELGVFYGCVRKSTSQPEGFGVFVANGWAHCGEVRNGLYTEGRKVSASFEAKTAKLTASKWEADGSVL